MIDRWKAAGCIIYILSALVTLAVLGRILGILTGHNHNVVR